jgi:PAS domain S-box-containing protein
MGDVCLQSRLFGCTVVSADDSDSESVLPVIVVGMHLLGRRRNRGARVPAVSHMELAREDNPDTHRPPEGFAPLEDAFASGTPQRVGWYRFYFADQRWHWSPEVEQIHGYQPGTITPTTELVLSHKHPDDYQHIAATLEDIRQTHRPFSSRHRIITARGDTRDIVVIGERLRDDSGDVIGTHGYYIDVTRSDEARDKSISDAVADFAAHRAAIEQAKGVLMSVYRVDAAVAFAVLKWRSQETNTKVRDLAEQLVTDVRTLGPDDEDVSYRSTFDGLFLTAHERIKATAERSRS